MTVAQLNKMQQIFQCYADECLYPFYLKTGNISPICRETWIKDAVCNGEVMENLVHYTADRGISLTLTHNKIMLTGWQGKNPTRPLRSDALSVFYDLPPPEAANP